MILANGCNITKSEKFKGVWILSVPTVCKDSNPSSTAHVVSCDSQTNDSYESWPELSNAHSNYSYESVYFHSNGIVWLKNKGLFCGFFSSNLNVQLNLSIPIPKEMIHLTSLYHNQCKLAEFQKQHPSWDLRIWYLKWNVWIAFHS